MRNSVSQSPADDEAVVRQSITVPLAPAAAFALWTDQIHTWWPVSHSRSGDPATQVIFERGIGGRFYERTADGTEFDWGHVVVWQPPEHLAYHWYLGSGPTQPTRVDVRFVAVGEAQTQVEVVHRGPELIGELWRVNNARYRAAWAVVLPAYAAAVTAAGDEVVSIHCFCAR
jgi:hypothetical protein